MRFEEAVNLAQVVMEAGVVASQTHGIFQCRASLSMLASRCTRKPQQIPGIGMLGLQLQDLAVKIGGGRQVAGLVEADRLLEWIRCHGFHCWLASSIRLLGRSQ